MLQKVNNVEVHALKDVHSIGQCKIIPFLRFFISLRRIIVFHASNRAFKTKTAQ